MFRSYILCATPRSGSTLLCDLLSGTGVAGHPNSYYRWQGVAEYAGRWNISGEGRPFEGAYLAAVLRAGAGDTGVFGLRLMYGTVAELSRRLDTLYPGLPDDGERFQRAFGRCLYIHLSRQDKVAQAVSLLRADQSGLWHVAADGTERERSAPPGPAVYDAARLGRFVDELEADDAAWTAWFARYGIEPLRLTYETLSNAPQAALADILIALGRDPAVAARVAPNTSKMADDTSRAWAARFRGECGPPGM